MKRLISLMLTVIMLLALMPFSALNVSAETVTDSQGVTYTLSDDGTYYIISDCDTSVTSVTIPAKYNGLPVTTIGDYAFSDCSNLSDIYCEAEEQPKGWNENWLGSWNGDSTATVHWGAEMSNKPTNEPTDKPTEDKPSTDKPTEDKPSTDNPIEDEPTDKPSDKPDVPPVVEEPEEITLGDVNGNSEIDSMDYILLKRAYFGTFNLTEEAQKIADITKNGEIDSMDYILLKRAYFGTYEIK